MGRNNSFVKRLAGRPGARLVRGFGLAQSLLNHGAPVSDQAMISIGTMMMSRFASIALSALSLTLLASSGLVAPAHASICQGKSLSLDETVDVIKATPTCDASLKLAQDCAYGASGDVSLAGAVREKCEADFLAKLKPPQKKTYQREQQACLRKYAHKSGTMYVSFSAFCSAELAQRYSQRARKLKR
jgi:hypothetical protein